MTYKGGSLADETTKEEGKAQVRHTHGDMGGAHG